MEALNRLTEIIRDSEKSGHRTLIAIDGRCAAGKTSLASRMQKEFGCSVFHMDDFFLRPEQRTEERLRIPGGNVDYERFFFRCTASFAFRRGMD